MKISRYNFLGSSLAGNHTSIYIPELNIQLDAGKNIFKTKNIIISHTHGDHIKSLPDICQNHGPVNIICNDIFQKLISNYLKSFFKLNSYNNFVNFKKYFTFNQPIKNIHIEEFPVKHSIPCFSYGIYIIKKKLKKEYLNLPHQEIINLKKYTNITDNILYPEILFATDLEYTSISSLPIIKFNIIIIECTFFYPEHIIEARNKLHLHWTDIKPIIETYPDKHFILIHPSPRYIKEYDKIKEIVSYTNAYLFPFE